MSSTDRSKAVSPISKLSKSDLKVNYEQLVGDRTKFFQNAEKTNINWSGVQNNSVYFLKK